VLGVLPGIIAMIQATEAIKLLVGKGTSLAGRLLVYDAMAMEFTEFKLSKDPECPVCGEHPTVTELIDYDGFCGMPTEADGQPVVDVVQIGASELRARRERRDDFLLLDVREPDEHERARIHGAELVPLAELADRLSELAGWRDRDVVVHCHHGGRSVQACKLLLGAGFTRVVNLDGGIEAWSVTIDPDVPRY
jgi:adenylyltransferase/sulfurtransferase